MQSSLHPKNTQVAKLLEKGADPMLQVRQALDQSLG